MVKVMEGRLPADVQLGNVRGVFYMNMKGQPCIRFITIMGLPLGAYQFNPDMPSQHMVKFATRLADLIDSFNFGGHK